MRKPRLKRIAYGWAAYGEGWAVDGETKEEALARFREAEQKHLEIDALPFTYDHTLLDLQELEQSHIHQCTSA